MIVPQRRCNGTFGSLRSIETAVRRSRHPSAPRSATAAGPHATADPDEKGRRQDRLQRAEAAFDALPFDADAARAYGRVFAVVMTAGQKARGRRAVDLLIAAAALSAELPLYTRNGDDFRILDSLIEVVVV